MRIETFAQAEAYLLGTINEGISRRTPDRLERMRMLLHEAGRPDERFPVVQVGGTSGKGSTSTMIAAALQASGKRVGLHTKPHLVSMRERARVDGAPVSEERFAELLDDMMPAIERTTAAIGRPTYYETLLALALAHFAREDVDVAVIEVGIGGRLDGTNVLTPLVCAITNVGLDHTEILGETTAEIAADKVGIAKPGVPLVSDARDPDARRVIAQGCASAGAPLVFVDETARIDARATERYGSHAVITTARGTYDVTLPIVGAFQQRNAATAIVVLEQLPERLRPSIADVERGLAAVVIAGRMEFFPGHPSVVFDIAHNPDKAATLATALRETFAERRFWFVVAIAESKDAPAVLARWFELPASFVFTTFSAAGRTPTRPQRLVNIASAAGVAARAIEDPLEAITLARRSASGGDVVVVAGSTFVVAQLRSWWLEHVGERSTR